MNISTWAIVLIATVPSLSAGLTIIGGVLKVLQYIKNLKKEHNKELEISNTKLLRTYDNIAQMKTKIASIEKLLIEQKEKK